MNLNLVVEEDGATLEENAKKKATAYWNHLKRNKIYIMADDTGIQIDSLNGEPGIKVRRWIGRPMSDEEIIHHCIEKNEKYSNRKKDCQIQHCSSNDNHRQNT